MKAKLFSQAKGIMARCAPVMADCFFGEACNLFPATIHQILLICSASVAKFCHAMTPQLINQSYYIYDYHY